MSQTIHQIVVVDFETAKNVACWGTYSKNSDQPLMWKRLVDCETEHLQAILRTQSSLTQTYLEIINSIVKDRGEIPDKYSPEAARELSDKFRTVWIKL